ncbi:hypothetical protein HMPREF9141_0569 [Prevotella multiformis DSM 16608]|uniref:Uncharacterized protein n=1 Tax=Prevotella multiformis DSM 16608 TaxID=888743 RepID=F0F4Q3_9BACT|nr:hypothetical protein HMPREF9141_0569 [Prevotella multiformis DSM 16608]
MMPGVSTPEGGQVRLCHYPNIQQGGMTDLYRKGLPDGTNGKYV